MALMRSLKNWILRESVKNHSRIDEEPPFSKEFHFTGFIFDLNKIDNRKIDPMRVQLILIDEDLPVERIILRKNMIGSPIIT